jgi:DNA-binding response OmpR family regulator
VNSLTILYAEDETVTRENYANYLRRFFKDVIEAEDGAEAYEQYLKNRPDILLLDIDMPQYNGLEVARKIREIDKKCKIIMLTAVRDVDKLIEATELKLTKYLTKPINRKELKEALYIARSELEEEELLDICEGLFWNKEKKELLYKGVAIKLSKFERAFFEKILSKKGQIFSQEELIVAVWGEDELLKYNPNKLKDLVKRIRKKLPFDCIENVYSMGYKINNDTRL